MGVGQITQGRYTISTIMMGNHNLVIYQLEKFLMDTAPILSNLMRIELMKMRKNMLTFTVVAMSSRTWLEMKVRRLQFQIILSRALLEKERQTFNNNSK